MEPNPTPSTATPPNVGAPIVEYIRTQRQNAGSMLAILSVLLLALTVYLALKAFRAPPTADKPADQQQKENPLEPEKPPPTKPPAEGADAQRTDYMFGWLGTLCAFLAVGSVATWLLVAPPAPDESRQRTDARVAI